MTASISLRQFSLPSAYPIPFLMPSLTDSARAIIFPFKTSSRTCFARAVTSALPSVAIFSLWINPEIDAETNIVARILGGAVDQRARKDRRVTVRNLQGLCGTKIYARHNPL